MSPNAAVLAVVAVVLGAPAPAPPNTLSLAAPGEPGIALVVSGVVRDAQSGRPLSGAKVVVFNADAHGRYTRDKAMDEPHARLRGELATDSGGRFEVRTVRPGGYAGKDIPQHVHFQVAVTGYEPRSIQMAFSDDPRMTPKWHEWARKLRFPVVSVRQVGRVAHCAVVIELTALAK